MRPHLLPTPRLHPRAVLAMVAVLACVLVAPAVASANTTTSDNWGGYAAHGSAVHFRTVTATWRQPAGTCTAGDPTYSAFWVGIGGYSLNSDALEQIGSELDCGANGTEQLSAWYELVPAPSRTIRMTLAPGDLIKASVNVVGDQVTMTLHDTTRHETFAKTITDHTIDTTSAEWITEAPSECYSATKCETLPLADFGAVRFSGATATTTTGRTAPITSALWTTTKIDLSSAQAGTTRFVSDTSSLDATPSALTDAGKEFTVAYTGTSSSSGTSSTGSSGSTGTGGTGGTSPGGSGGGGGYPGGPGGYGGGGAGGGGFPGPGFGQLRR